MVPRDSESEFWCGEGSAEFSVPRLNGGMGGALYIQTPAGFQVSRKTATHPPAARNLTVRNTGQVDS